MEKKVSIIVPIYNTEKYLERSIDSIIAQSHKNLEIILINDGSSDKSIEICKEYQKKDKRIVVIDKEHTGVSDSRNIGIMKATGDYIGFVDSDDYIEADMFKILVEAAEKHGADISMCDLKETSKGDEKNTYKVDFVELSKNEALNNLLYDKNIGNYMCVKLFKRKLFENITFPVNQMFEDISVAYKLFNKSNKIIYTNTVLYYYFQRSSSIVNNETRESLTDYLNAVFNRYYDLKNSNDQILLYNVYSIVNVLIRVCKCSIKIKDYELYENIISGKYYEKVKEDLKLVDEIELIKLMDDFERDCFLILKKNREGLRNFMETNMV